MSIRRPPTVMVRNTPTLASYLGFLSAQALLEAIAIPVEFQHMATMGQAIEQCPSEPFVTKDFSPAAKLQIGGDDHTASEIAVSADLEQQSGPIRGEGDKAHLIQDQQVQLLELGQPFPQGPLLLGFPEFIDETSGGSETPPLPPPAGQPPHGQGTNSLARAPVPPQDQ